MEEAAAAVEDVDGAGVGRSRVVERGANDDGCAAAAPAARDREAEPVVLFGCGVEEAVAQGAGGAVEEEGGAGVVRSRVIVGGADDDVCADGRDRPAEGGVRGGSGVEEGLEEGAAGAVEEVGGAELYDEKRGLGVADEGIFADARDREAEGVVRAGCGVGEAVEEGAPEALEEPGLATSLFGETPTLGVADQDGLEGAAHTSEFDARDRVPPEVEGGEGRAA